MERAAGRQEKNSVSEALMPKTIEEYRDNSEYLTKAYKKAEEAHQGQNRDSGEPYITHCLEVARIMYEEWKITNKKLIAATFLHDTVEDNKDVTLEDLSQEFGKDVSSWVDGVTKLKSKDKTLQKFNNATYIEPQTGIIKSGDRLHNMRTLEFKKSDSKKKEEKARETLFYAKLAESLGMWDVMRELEDLSFKYINPDEYDKYLHLRDDDPRTDKAFVEGFKSNLRAIVEDVGIEATVGDRKNSLLRIKDKRGNKLPDKIDDLIRFEIVVKDGENELETRNRVGIVLMALWNKFDSVEEKLRFDNFYFTPQDNGYSSIHMTFRLSVGCVKIVVTSNEKQIYNNSGILTLVNNEEVNLHEFALKLIFTPTGEVKFFKPNATGVDYAYSISPKMGASASYMLFNGEEDKEENRHQVTEIIPNGTSVLIKTDDSRKFPKKLFGNFALSPAKKIIDEQIEEQNKYEKAMLGKVMVEEIMKERGFLDIEDLKEIEELKPVYNDVLLLLGCKDNIMDLYYKAGSDTENFIPQFISMLDQKEITKDKMGYTTVYVEGVDHIGISAFVTKEIADLGGSIVFQKGNVSKISKSFSLKFIVDDLPEDNKEKLPEYFNGRENITKVVIV